MTRPDWGEVAELIHLSTNFWYQSHGMGAIFKGDPASTILFCEVYESLDPGCCIVAVNDDTQKIVGSCFYHPRPTHVSLGIMNVHPNYFGASIASRLLKFIVDFANERSLPVRLVSSALNLDSYSLYTRSGFVPQMAFQDMYFSVPESGLGFTTAGQEQVRPATLDDVPAIAALEEDLAGISRAKDYEYFLTNTAGIWHGSVFENDAGQVDGFLMSVRHPASNMIGPGTSRNAEQAAALIHAELDHNRGGTPVFLIPVACGDLVKTLYGWGARNCEIHFAQIRGEWKEPSGVVMPTFMPETG